jgi:hypothetical protein
MNNWKKFKIPPIGFLLSRCKSVLFYIRRKVINDVKRTKTLLTYIYKLRFIFSAAFPTLE